ncbi:MAG: amidohydrolase family protein [Candidatus Aminicenantia bacterium]
MKRIFNLILIFLLLSLISFSSNNKPILIKNATIYPITSPKIEKGSILIENGKIVAIGKEIQPPEGAKIIDTEGKNVYPGFIDGFTHLGLVEISSLSSTVDVQETGKFNPELRVGWAINPHSVHIATSRINGTTTALVSPRGGTMPGFTAIIKLDGWTFQEMVLKDIAASVINFPAIPRFGRVEGRESSKTQEEASTKLIDELKNYFKDARKYIELKKLSKSNPEIPLPEPNRKFDALEHVLNGEIPMIISVDKEKDIELAIKFIQEEKIKAIFKGCAEGFKVAEKIKKAGIPVILSDLYTFPSEPEDGYDAPFLNPSKLAEAGVLFCFSSGGSPAVAKDLTYHAARAVAFGLDYSKAIEALTINPARIFGIDNRVGSLEPGKDADFFICDGDPLDVRTNVTNLFINGKEVDLSNWWTELENKANKRFKD